MKKHKFVSEGCEKAIPKIWFNLNDNGQNGVSDFNEKVI